MRKRLLALIVLLLLLILAALLAWLVLRENNDAPGATPDDAEELATDRADETVRQRITKTSAAVTQDTPDATMSAEPTVEVTPWPDTGVEVDVVRGADDEPVAGALVWVRLSAPGAWRLLRRDELMREAGDPLAALRKGGRVFRADDSGHVRLPAPQRWPPGNLWAVAEHDGLIGQLGVRGPAAEEPQKLVLLPRTGVEVRVRVRGATGELLPRFPVQLAASDEWSDFTFALADTNDEGLAAFRDTGDLRDWGADDDMLFFVRAGAPGLDPPRAHLDLARLPSEPVELVLPPTGEVRVHVAARDGGPYTGEAYVALASARSESYRDPDRAQYVDVTGGTAHFPHIGLGGELVARLSDPSRRLASTELSFAGPERAGTRVDVTLTLGGERLIVRGRLVGADGAALAGEQIAAEFQRDDVDRSLSGEGSTDSEGRFRLILDHDRNDVAGASLGFVIWKKVGGSVTLHQLGSVRLPPALSESVHDVGDVVAETGDVIAAGRLVGPDGAPIADEAVAVLQETANGWARRYDIAATTDSDGRFEVRGTIPPGKRVRLALRSDSYMLERLPTFDAGAIELELRAIVGGSIAGSLKLPQGLDGDDLDIVVTGPPAKRPTTRDPDGGEVVVGWAEDDGTFAVKGLLSGSADVTLRLSGGETPILVIRSVSVTLGEETRDSRLHDVDLSKHVRARVVRTVDASGAPIAHAHVHFRPTGTREDWIDTRTDAGGRAVVNAPAGPLDILALAEEFTSASVIGVADGTTLRLKRAQPVAFTVTLDPNSATPGEGRAMQVQIVWMGPPATAPPDADHEEGWDDPRGRGFDDLPLGRGRNAVYSITEPGWYRVIVMAGITNYAEFRMTHIDPAEGGDPFQIVPGTKTRTLTIRLTEESLLPVE